MLQLVHRTKPCQNLSKDLKPRERCQLCTTRKAERSSLFLWMQLSNSRLFLAPSRRCQAKTVHLPFMEGPSSLLFPRVINQSYYLRYSYTFVVSIQSHIIFFFIRCHFLPSRLFMRLPFHYHYYFHLNFSGIPIPL